MMAEQSDYFLLSDADKIDALETGASRLGRPADLLEKDIWVVWALNVLFESPYSEHLVFKGGTSLSKVYKAIDRFSEDVDITYDIRQIIPDLIGDPGNPYPANRSQTKKWTEAVRTRLSEWLEAEMLPLIANRLKSQGAAASVRQENDNLYLDYQAIRGGTGYVRSTVLLEFGARSTGEPAERHAVNCDLSEAVEGLILPEANPRVMSAERTFWEKATAIHAYCLRGTFRGGDRYARNWFDLNSLDRIGLAQTALGDRGLAADVAEHKGHFFRENDRTGQPIDYQSAIAGFLCLVPTGEPLKALEVDYSKMIDAGLLQANAISFSELMDRLSGLQNRANAKEG